MSEKVPDAASLPFSSDVVASFSCHGIEPGKDGTGQSKVNQDCACICYPFCSDARCALFCVFDGHGRHGEAVSSAAMDFIVADLEERLLADQPIPEAIEAAYVNCNLHLRDAPDVNARWSGCCALSLLLHDRRLWCAGAGDCRAVLGMLLPDEGDGPLLEAERLSRDHKPDDPDERVRIEACGAGVRPGCDDPFEPARVYRDVAAPRKGPGLAMSRCLGDLADSGCGIVPTPTIAYRELVGEGDESGRREAFVVLASDGVWEHIGDEEAVELVSKFWTAGKPAQLAATNLIAHAALRWRYEEGNYRDDITAIVAYLPCLPN